MAHRNATVNQTEAEDQPAIEITEADMGTLINRIPDDERVTYTEKGAADYLSLSPETLKIYRRMRKGPDFSRFGRRVVYTKGALDAYLDRHKVSFNKSVIKSLGDVPTKREYTPEEKQEAQIKSYRALMTGDLTEFLK